MRAHCLFEQSGTFKNEFKKLGIEAFDYDILNDYGQTDFQIDLFSEIESAYKGEQSIFDDMSSDDLILAFFPCTRFEAKIPLWFRGEAAQLKNWDDCRKLQNSIELHKELHRNYVLICKMAYHAIKHNLRMVIENPYTQPHYLTTYWCLKPKIIDKNRRLNGDYMEKPTQYYFIGFEPKNNILFEPIDWVEHRVVSGKNVLKKDTGKDRQVTRSEMHPQYANRFIRKYLIDYEQDFSKLYERSESEET